MKRKFLYFLSLLIFLHSSIGFDLNNKSDKLKQVEATDEEAPTISLNLITPCTILVDWTCSDTCKDSLDEYKVYWQNLKTKVTYNYTASFRSNYYTITGLNASQTYNVWVSSVKGEEEHPSDIKAGITKEGVAFAINDVTATDNGDVIDVEWTASANPCPIMGYHVEWSGTANWDPKLIVADSSETEETYLTIWDYVPDAEYTITVNEITTDDKVGNASDPQPFDTLESIPGPPLYATSKTLDSSSVNLNWKTPSAANGIITGYQISCTLPDLEGDQCGAVPQIPVLDLDDYYYNVTELLDCGNYTFSIQAVNNAGPGEPVTTESRTDAGRPGLITNFGTTAVGSTTVNLTWEISNTHCPAIIYRLRGTATVLWDDDREEIVTTSFTTDANSYQLTTLIPYSSYSLRLSARTQGGNTTSDNNAEFQTDEGAASPPTNVISHPIDQTSVSLFWSPPEDKNGIISNYYISCKRSKRGDEECDITTPIVDEIYQINNLKACGNYTFEVSAINGAEEPGEVATTESTTDSEAPPDIDSTTFKVSGRTSTNITVTFDSPETDCPLTYYVIGKGDILWSDDVHPVNQVFSVDEAGTTTLIIVDLIPYTNYTLNITGHSEGGYTNSIIFNQQTTEAPPSAPGNFAAEPVDSTTNIKLTWDQPDINGRRILSYHLSVYQREEEVFTDTLRGSSKSHTIRGLNLFNHCDFYKVSLSARNDRGTGPAASDYSTIAPDLPNRPTGLKCTTKGPNDIEITWKIAETNCRIESYEAELTGYIRWDLTDTNATESFSSRDSRDKTYTITDLIPDTEYEITLAAATGAGLGRFSTSCNVLTDVDVPQEPTDLMVIDRSKSSITIRWSNPEMSNGYLKQFRVNLTSKDDVISHNVTAINKTEASVPVEYTFEIKDLDDDVNYKISVTAENDAGLGASADTDAFTEKSHLGAILGTVIPVVVIIICVIGGVWYYKSHNKKKNKVKPDN